MKKIILATLIFGAMANPVFAADEEAPSNAGSGTVTFTGSIIEAACGIAPESVDQTIKLGQIAKNILVDGGSSTPVPFTIELIDCDTATQKTATVTFTGGVNTGTNNSLALQGTAAGAGVQISGLNGKLVEFNGDGTGNSSVIQDGDNTLLFSAFLKGLGGEADSITPGAFTAVTNFTMSYQ